VEIIGLLEQARNTCSVTDVNNIRDPVIPELSLLIIPGPRIGAVSLWMFLASSRVS
jgi:hypothetical protein